MLNKTKQIRNSFIYMIPLGLASLLPLITIPIFTRILSPEDYGILALTMIYGVFMSGIANFATSMGFERNYFKYQDNPEQLAQLLFSCLVFVFANFTLLFIITYLFKENISELFTGSAKYGNMIIAAFAGQFFFVTINNFFFIYFKNVENATIYSKYKIYNALINFSLSMFLVAYLQIGIIGIIIAQLITGIILFIILSFSFLIKFHFSINKDILVESLKFSYPLVPKIFLNLFGSQFDKYMIGLLATIEGVGIYHIGRKISDLLFTFITVLQNVFQPQVYQRMFNKKRDSIAKYLMPFLYLSTFSSLIVALFCHE